MVQVCGGGCRCYKRYLLVFSAAQKAVKQTWTEHQDEELKTLFDEFYQLPQDAAAEHGPLTFLTLYSILATGYTRPQCILQGPDSQKNLRKNPKFIISLS